MGVLVQASDDRDRAKISRSTPMNSSPEKKLKVVALSPGGLQTTPTTVSLTQDSASNFDQVFRSDSLLHAKDCVVNVDMNKKFEPAYKDQIGEKQRSSNHAHQVLDKMPKTATMTKTKGNFSVSFSDLFLSCSQSSFVNVVDNLAPGKCSVDEINQPSSEVEDMVFDKMPRPILTVEGNSGKPFVPSSSEPFSPCVGFAVSDLNPDRMLGNRRKQVGEKGDLPNPAHKMIDKMSVNTSYVFLKDGAGRVGKMLFYRQGKKFDYDLKQLCFAGDLLMELGAGVELETVAVPHLFLPLAYTANVAKLPWIFFRMAKTIIDVVLALSFDDSPSKLAAAALFYISTSD
ncbi:hypothetical protein U1Q18_017971, partial [Sarracenia purpurea var. burkii]